MAASDDENRAAVVVLTHEMNDRLFGGRIASGRQSVLAANLPRDRRTATLAAPAAISTTCTMSPFGESDQIFLPFNRAIEKQMKVLGQHHVQGWLNDFGSLLQSDCVWLQFWVELPSAADAQRYRDILEQLCGRTAAPGPFPLAGAHPAAQRKAMARYRHVVPSEVNILLLVSFGFLLVCVLNAVGLMLAKIMGRAGDIGVRRALGANRARNPRAMPDRGRRGGPGRRMLGLVLTHAGTAGAARSCSPSDSSALTNLDPTDVGIAVLLAIVATIAAGLYPTWRAAHVQPAWQLKAQ